MALLTVAQLREHVETALPDSALERILAASEQAIATWAGPLEVDEAGVVMDVTERVWAPGRVLLRLHQLPVAITRVTDVVNGVETPLDPSAYRLESRLVRRLSGTWGEWTTVVYTPTDDSAVRRTVLVQLCQLELNAQPGMASQGAGGWSESYRTYLRQRDELLRVIRPADPPVPRAVPYSGVDAA